MASTNRKISELRISVLALSFLSPKNTSTTPAQQTTSVYLLILASFTAMPMKKEKISGEATGSSRQSMPPSPRTISMHRLRKPPFDGMNWQNSASSPRQSTAMPATPRGSTP